MRAGPPVGFNGACMIGVPRATTVALSVLALSLVALTACAGDESAAPPSRVDVPETVALGEVPAEPVATRPPAPPTAPPPSTDVPATLAPDERIAGPLADEVFGNRVLLIGDDVLATTAPRFLGTMCDVLPAQGWDVEIDAEPGRFVDFADTVLDRRLRPDGGLDWDVVGVMLGNWFDGDYDAYARAVTTLIDTVQPRPLVLYTVTEFGPNHVRINEFVRDRVRFHPNVVVIDWAATTSEDGNLVKFPDKPTPSEEGERRLVALTAEVLGTIGDSPGSCLPAAFEDDSAIVL